MFVKGSSYNLSKVSSAATSPTSGFIKTELSLSFKINHNNSSSSTNRETI